MSERKVLNKYYPPDFDPSKIPRLRLPRDRQYTVRLMAPCNMKCTTCGEYVYKGKKFNARKETVQNEEYLGIKIFRFYIKCPRCLAEITFKTDPQNADYIVEHGATRNFQALKLAEEAAAREARELEEEEKNNPMKLLENRTQASKQEMQLMETLEELKDLNQRHSKVDLENLLQQKRQKLVDEAKMQEEEDEAMVRSLFGKSGGMTIKRIVDEEDEVPESTVKKESQNPMVKKPKLTGGSIGILSNRSKGSLVKLKVNGGETSEKPSSTSTANCGATSQKPSSSSTANGGATSQKPSTNFNTVKASQDMSSSSAISEKAAAPASGLSLLGAYSDSGEDSG